MNRREFLQRMGFVTASLAIGDWDVDPNPESNAADFSSGASLRQVYLLHPSTCGDDQR